MDIDGIKTPARRSPPRSTDGIVPAAHVRRTPAASKPRLASPVAVPAAAAVSNDTAAAESKLFPLPRYYAPERPAKVTRKRASKKMVIFRSAAVCLLVLLSTAGFLGWKAYSKFHKVFHGTSTVAALASKPVTPDLLKGEGDGRVNILLLGIGGPGHDGPDLTDTIMLLSVDPVNNTATMLSVPRDLWVNQPIPYFGSQQKINAAYESGKYHYLGHNDASSANAAAVEAGFSNLDAVIKTVLDVNVNYHMLVDFQAFKQAVDTVGGVTVNVPTELYDPTMAWENHNSPILAAAGVQQMNGTQALLYARSRETTSDFARGQRQRQILVALKDKVLTAGTLSNPAKIDALMNAFGDNVYSDLSTQGATRLFSIMQKIGDNNIDSIGLTDPPHALVTTDHVGTTSVDRPLAGFNDYADIQSYVRSQIPDGYIIKEKAPVTVVGATTAVATAATTLLKSYGYDVTATTTASVSSTQVVDLSGGKDPFTLHYLEDRYGVKAVKSSPAGVTVAPGSAKFIVLTNK
ncbi:MAG: LCP family protein [Candidatus Saccharibacteria bacterium]